MAGGVLTHGSLTGRPSIRHTNPLKLTVASTSYPAASSAFMPFAGEESTQRTCTGPPRSPGSTTTVTPLSPGHGPAGDREVVSAQRRYLEQIIDAVQAEIDAGTSKEDAQEKSWPFMDGLGFEGIRPRAIGAVYDELKG